MIDDETSEGDVGDIYHAGPADPADVDEGGAESGYEDTDDDVERVSNSYHAEEQHDMLEFDIPDDIA